MFVVGVLVAGLTYAVAQYYSFRDNVIVAHQGQGSTILKTNLADANFDTGYFQRAGDGRFNLLLLGVGGDNHPGSYLTDSIQLVSLDTVNKKISMTSVPRDLYVTIPGHGKGKINSVYQFGEQDKKGGGGLLIRQVLGGVLGVNISNYMVLDFNGAKDLINAVGGIDINVPKAIYDPLFPADNTIDYAPFSISAGEHHMDGELALKYARSRETTSDFDRSARQQLVMSALKAKVTSLDVLTNPAKLSNLINVLGSHMRTDLQTEEIRSFVGIYKDSELASSQVLDNTPKLGLLTDVSDPVSGYTLRPILGVNDYTAIKQWFAKNNPDPLLVREKATITVASSGYVNKTDLQNFINALTDYGFKANLSLSAYTGDKLRQTTIYKKNNSKPITLNYLSSYFNGSQIDKSTPLDSGSDFEIIYVSKTKN